FGTSARSTSSRRAYGGRTSTNGARMYAWRSSSRELTSTELGRRVGCGRRQGDARSLSKSTDHQGQGGRQMRKVGAFLMVAVGATMLAAPVTAGAQPLSFTFDSNNQGWGQTQDNGATVTTAGFQAAGGNPGGHLDAVDTLSDSGCSTPPTFTPCNLLY